MTHSDPDAIAMMAMGDPDVPAADVHHIESCGQCRSELRSLNRVADLARSGRPHEPFPAPSPAVWDRISATLRLDPGLSPPDSSSAGSGSGASGDRRHRAPRRRRGRAVAVLVGVVAVAAVVTGLVLIEIDPVATIAEARLESPPGGTVAAGEAVVEERDGVRDLRIDIDADDPAPDSYREVWLISSDLTRLVSLGTIDGPSGTVGVPDGIDLADFPVVDVSNEPLDGDPAHSGDSVVRGTLDS